MRRLARGVQTRAKSKHDLLYASSRRLTSCDFDVALCASELRLTEDSSASNFFPFFSLFRIANKRIVKLILIRGKSAAGIVERISGGLNV